MADTPKVPYELTIRKALHGYIITHFDVSRGLASPGYAFSTKQEMIRWLEDNFDA